MKSVYRAVAGLLLSIGTSAVAQDLACFGSDCFVGPVGIGTGTPAQKLEVYDGFLGVTRPVGSGASAGLWLSQQNVAGNNGLWSLASRQAGHLAFYNAGLNGDAMNLLPGGNVGIGTQAPGQRLEIVKDDADVALRFHDPTDAWYTMGINRASGGAFYLNYGPDPGWRADWTINPSGKVGVGTASASDTLTVQGTVRVGPGRVIDSVGRWVGDPTGLKGPSGQQGPQGVTGASGAPGATGGSGATGATGATGSVGPRGPTGFPGQAGPAGPVVTTLASCGFNATCANGWFLASTSHNTGAIGCQAATPASTCSAPASPNAARCIVCANVSVGGGLTEDAGS